MNRVKRGHQKDMFYTYILHSKKDKKLYIGYTNNLKRRMIEHENGKNIATKHRLPMNLIYYESFISMKDAKAREKYLKSGYGRKQLKEILLDTFNKINYK